MIRKPIIATLSVLLLLSNALAPAISAASHLVQNRAKTIAIPVPKPMVGVPVVDFSRHAGGPSKSPYAENLSKLSDQLQLRANISPGDIRIWTKLSASPTPSRTKARALIYLAEMQMVSEQPQKAVQLLSKAAQAAPKRSNELGLARLDRAICTFLEGRYKEAKEEFLRLRKSGAYGMDLKRIAGLARHAADCSGYHQQRAALGITEPKEIDPLCAVSSLAVCLRELHLPYSKDLLLRSVRFTGEGSNMADVVAAAPKLGATAYVVTSSDKSRLMALPMPLVAHAEHDHFLAITKITDKQITYNCSDCGIYPGGFKHITWKQLAALECDAFAVIVKSGSPLDTALRTDAWLGTKDSADSAGPFGELLASITPNVPLSDSPQAVAAAQRAARAIENISLADNRTQYALIQCGTKMVDPRCPSCNGRNIKLCLMQKAGVDPVDVATGEEEYGATDMTVYNPVGPSVSLSRIYESLRTEASPFGQGWSQPYNMTFNWSVSTGSGGGGSAPSLTYVFPNGAEVVFALQSGHTMPDSTTTHPSEVLVAPRGYPMYVTLIFDGPDSINLPTYHMTILMADHTLLTSQVGEGFGHLATLTNGNSQSLTMNYNSYTVAGASVSILDSISGGGSTLVSFAVDSNGHYTSATDCYSRRILYSFTSDGNLQYVSPIVSSTTSTSPALYTYGYANEQNGDGENGYGSGPSFVSFWYLSSISMPSPTGTGLSTTTIAYDYTYGLVGTVTDANGNYVTFTDGPASNAETVNFYNPSNTLEYSYTGYFDSNMALSQVNNANGDTEYLFNYADANDPFRPSSVTDGFSSPHTTSMTWDVFGNMLTETTQKGTERINSYDYTFQLGELSTTHEQLSSTTSQTPTSFTYEPSGQIETVTTPVPGTVGSSSTQTTTYTYTSLGNLASVTSPGNNASSTHTVNYGYTTDGSYSQSEALGQPITVTDSLSKVTHLRYDSLGNLLNSTDPNANEWQATYNIANQVTETEAPATGNKGTGNATTVPTYLYIGGPVTSETAYDESGTSTRNVSYTFGPQGETLGVSGDGETTTYTYGSPYWINSITDGNSHTTTYTHGTTANPFSGDLNKVSYPLASGGTDTVNYVYNVMHQPTQRTDGNSVVTNYSYSDGDGLLSAISYPASTSLNVGITYDGYDRTSEVTDGTGSITDSFDDLNEVTQSVRVYTGVSSNTLTYSRYPDGSRSAMTVVGSSRVDLQACKLEYSIVSPK